MDDLPALYISGWAPQEIVKPWLLAPRPSFLDRAFDVERLLDAVAVALA